MANDFLAQVKEAEKKVAEMIKKALKKKADDLLKYKQDLAKKNAESFKVFQNEMKDELKKSRVSSREKYEEKIAEGNLEVEKMKSDKINMLESLMSGAGDLFLSNL